MPDYCNHPATCENCEFYYEIEAQNEKGEDMVTGEGTCRARAPVVTQTNQRFPIVQPWEPPCGVFRRNNLFSYGQQ